MFWILIAGFLISTCVTIYYGAKIMAAIDDLQAQVAAAATDIGAHLDALDASISTEITNAQNAVTAALATAGATPAQIKVVSDAFTALDTSLGTRIDATKAKADAAFPTPAPKGS